MSGCSQSRRNFAEKLSRDFREDAYNPLTQIFAEECLADMAAYKGAGKMVGVRFSRIAEQKSAELAESLVSKLMESPRTTAYRKMDAESLREAYREFFVDLTEWLIYRTEAEVAEKCMQLGIMRAGQGVPLEQCVNAMLACRDHLVEYLRLEATEGSDVELFGELEFVVAVGHFFDDAIFFCMRGHKACQAQAVA